MKHYVLCLHDETLECIATGLRAKRQPGGVDDVVRLVSTRLLLDE